MVEDSKNTPAEKTHNRSKGIKKISFQFIIKMSTQIIIKIIDEKEEKYLSDNKIPTAKVRHI